MRYERDSSGWMVAIKDPPTYMGQQTTEASRFNGSLIAARRGSGGYWLDPDGFLVDDPDFRHFIWLCGAWQMVKFESFHPSDLEPTRKTRTVLVHVNVEIGEDGTIDASVPLAEEL